MAGRGRGKRSSSGNPFDEEDLESTFTDLDVRSVFSDRPRVGRGLGRGARILANTDLLSGESSLPTSGGTSTSSSSGGRSQSRGRGRPRSRGGIIVPPRRPQSTEQFHGVLDEDKLSSICQNDESAYSFFECPVEKRSSSSDDKILGKKGNLLSISQSTLPKLEKNKYKKDSTMQLAQRPGAGVKNVAKFQVATNFYVASGKPKNAYLYRIDSELLCERADGKPPILNYEEAMNFFELFANQVYNLNGSPTSSSSSSSSESETSAPKSPMYFDGGNLFYTLERIDDQEMVVFRPDRPNHCRYKNVLVRIKKVKDLSLFFDKDIGQYDQLVLHMLETVLKASLYRKDYTRVKNSFYLLNKSARPADCRIPGKDVFAGFHITMKHVQSGLAIQPKEKLGVFHKSLPVLHYLSDIFQQEVANEHFWSDEYLRREACRVLKGLKVMLHSNTKSNGKIKVIKDITRGSAQLETFTLANGTKTNVADYFRNRSTNRQGLQYPRIPCMTAGARTDSNGQVYEERFPLEMCEILPKQPVKGVLDPAAISSLIRVSAKPAPQTFNGIKDSMKQARRELQQEFDNLDIKVSETMIKAEARVLPSPTLQYGCSRVENIMNGSWNPRRFIKPVTIKRWGCCIVSHRSQRNSVDTVNRAMDTLYRTANEHGMTLHPLAYQNMPNVISPNELEEFLKFCRQEEFELVLVVLDNKNGLEYARTKFISERLLDGLLTQCVLMKTLMRLNSQSASMILMKINAKLSGFNATIDFSLLDSCNEQALFTPDFPVMVQGLETNVMPGQKSILGLTTSFDPNATSYFEHVETTDNPNLMKDLERLEVDALRTYYKITRQKPKAIIFIRTAVNEHQINGTVAHEYYAIKSACKELQDDYEPKITFIMVTKNHATRMVAMDPTYQIGKSQNVPAGTVVDTSIVDRERFDFYLQSSQGIQGTSIPAKYIVCKDENNLSADSVEGLCYYLCHGYVRCNRTVSRPNALMYASLATDRARTYFKVAKDYISDERKRQQLEQLPEILDGKYKFEDQPQSEKKTISRLYKTMFYC